MIGEGFERERIKGKGSERREGTGWTKGKKGFPAVSYFLL